MTEEKKLKFIKFLEGRRRKKRGPMKSDTYVKGIYSFKYGVAEIRDEVWDPEVIKEVKTWKGALKVLNAWNSPNIYRGEYVGEWRVGIYKKVGGFYFSLFWNRGVRKGEKAEMKRELRARAALRRLLCPKATATDLYLNMMLDMFGPNKLFSNAEEEVGPLEAAGMCHYVMGLSYREIIDKYEKTIDYLIEHTRPKSGIIINRKYNHGEYSGRVGAMRGRVMAKRIEFLRWHDSDKSTKENMAYMKKRGLVFGYRTYLKYKKMVFSSYGDTIKELDLVI